jgi:mono/diheme cytochrome c family protein
MKAKILTFVVLAGFWSSLFLIQSCGKKDETAPTVDSTQMNQQQSITQSTEQKDTTQVVDKKSAEDLKKEEEAKKKAEEEKKKKEEEEKKKKEDEVKNDGTTSVDFAAQWPKKCAKCHGKDGTGKLEGVPNLTTGETKGKSLNELKRIIENGKKGKTDDDEDMPSFKGKLTEEEIDAAAKYVKGL